MKIEINITKQKFWVLMILVILVVGVFVFAANDWQTIGHSANEIGPGTIKGPITIDGDLTIEGNLAKGNECQISYGQYGNFGRENSCTNIDQIGWTSCPDGKFLKGMKIGAEKVDGQGWHCRWELNCC